MDWADELAARVSGPQVVNDSKTPSGTVHVGSLRGPVILDVITRALRAAGHETTLLYGVDDLDAMDAQALLTPDAIERFDGRSAGPHPGPGRGRACVVCAPPRPDLHRPVRRPGDPPGPLLLDERHLPDRGDGRLHPDGPGSRARRARSLPARLERPAPRHVASGPRHLRDVRQGRHHDRHEVGRRARLLRVPQEPGDLGPRLRDAPAGSPRSAGAPSCPGTSSGRPSGACSG